MMMAWPQFEATLNAALQARKELPALPEAQRLFNGFYEGLPELVIDRFAETLVFYNYAQPPEKLQPLLEALPEFLLERLPGVTAILLKTRFSADAAARRGRLIYGSAASEQVEENGVRYALDLTLNQDSSFYLDTRPLRAWLKANSAGKSVLNTFAYTGSLGAAAQAGGALQVVQTDRSMDFLSLARRTWALNGWSMPRTSLRGADFFHICGQLKAGGCRFDTVILDPPFFSQSAAGRVDWASQSTALINKVRPLVAHQGVLALVNNALYLSGADFMRSLEAICASGYLQIETLLPIPEDVTGTASTRQTPPPCDPAPFNHPTKIVLLRVRRKDEAPANCP